MFTLLMLSEFLNAIPGVLEAAVVGVPDKATGEALVACLSMDELEGPDTKALRAQCSSQLASYQVPKHFINVDSFPRTSLGKIQKLDLQKRVLEMIS